MIIPSFLRGLEIIIPKTVSQPCYVTWIKSERESDGSRHWEGIKSVLRWRDWVPFFRDEVRLQRIFWKQFKEKDRVLFKQRCFFCNSRSIHGHSGGFPIEPELMGYPKNLSNWKKYIHQRGFFMELSVRNGRRTDSRRQGKKTKPVKHSFVILMILLVMIRTERSLLTTSQFHWKDLMLRNGSMTRMQCSWYDCRKHRMKDWNSGKQNQLQSWITLLYSVVVLVVWHLPMENELISKALNVQGQYLTSRWKRIGKASSSSIPLLVQTFLASWKKCSWGSLDKRSTRRFETFHWSDIQLSVPWVECFWHGNRYCLQRGWYHRHDLTDWSCERRGGYRSHGQEFKTRSVSSIFHDEEHDV